MFPPYTGPTCLEHGRRSVIRVTLFYEKPLANIIGPRFRLSGSGHRFTFSPGPRFTCPVLTIVPNHGGKRTVTSLSRARARSATKRRHFDRSDAYCKYRAVVPENRNSVYRNAARKKVDQLFDYLFAHSRLLFGSCRCCCWYFHILSIATIIRNLEPTAIRATSFSI